MGECYWAQESPDALVEQVLVATNESSPLVTAICQVPASGGSNPTALACSTSE